MNIEEIYETPNSKRWARTSKVPLKNKEGEIIGVIGFAEDITERKKAEEELLRYRNYLEELVKDRTEDLETFTHIIAHDLRAPLRAIQGFSNSVKEEYGKELGDEGKKDIERICKAAENLDELITDLLDYSKVSRSKIELRNVNPNMVINECIEHLDDKIRLKDAEIDIESSIPLVKAHKPTLKLVLLNLISNSLKFVGPDVTPKISIYYEEGENNIKLMLEDNGIGISGDDQKIIFDVFEKLHSIEEYEGTGVGLAIVERSIEKMDGKVGVESKPGEGSKFWIELKKAV